MAQHCLARLIRHRITAFHFHKHLFIILTGGVIEACPPSDSTTAITVDMLIAPNGDISIVCMGDQIHADSPLQCWGLSVPQSSVEPEQLNASCYRIAQACKARGVVGYLTVDFVTFIHPKTVSVCY